ncbi:MAG: class I SAM-dependent RNA methyltransferase [Oscillospiraceae bacterium]|nr:class I SAM-dependent RNA methyltransferase [Oscillospiraceae bacterium]
METLQLCAPCLFGIEGILGDELRRMDAQQVNSQNGRVFFSGGADIIARANIGSRYAERIQIVIGRFTALSFEDLFQNVHGLPWERFIGKTDRFPVKGWSLESKLHSIPDCQSIIKKAVAERLKKSYNLSWFEETGSLYQIQFTILKDEVTILIDTSGAGLHKRGYRAIAGGAPIKETLAAAIADLARVRKAKRVLDPCCGSGTLLIESALSALRIAPGIRRKFISSSWNQVPTEVWRQERERARELELQDTDFSAWGGDIDPQAISLTMDNAKKAGVGNRITAALANLSEFEPNSDGGVVLCNPPYGERLMDVPAAEGLIREMGRVFIPKPYWSYYIISSHDNFEELFGRQADKRRKLYNGMLRCQLYMYYR